MVIMVDDERRYVEPYLMELDLRGIEVRFYDNVDAAWQALQTSIADVQLLILDIMMAPGELLADLDTRYGLRTGVRFYERIRELAPQLRVIILTNVADEQVAERFRNEGVTWLPKSTFPDVLADFVGAELAGDRTI